jgi:hypothetical protein
MYIMNQESYIFLSFTRELKTELVTEIARLQRSKDISKDTGNLGFSNEDQTRNSRTSKNSLCDVIVLARSASKDVAVLNRMPLIIDCQNHNEGSKEIVMNELKSELDKVIEKEEGAPKNEEEDEEEKDEVVSPLQVCDSKKKKRRLLSRTSSPPPPRGSCPSELSRGKRRNDMKQNEAEEEEAAKK